MTRKSAKSRNPNDLPRCRHIFPAGRRCRLSLCSDSRFYCRNHAHLQPPAGAVVDLSAELTAGVKKLTSASDINKFVSRLVVLLAEDRISPRRASVLIYACNLLLRTLPAIELERQRKLADQRHNFIGSWNTHAPYPDRRDTPQPTPPPPATEPSPQPPEAAANAAVPEQLPAEPNKNKVVPQPQPQPQPPITTQIAYNSFMRTQDTLENPPGRNTGFRRHRVY
jgi:hypothetical protein